jgi:hypothetical protein
MSDLAQILLSILVIASLALFISKRFRISKRYERQAKTGQPLNSWSALDQGIDPSQNESDKQ